MRAEAKMIRGSTPKKGDAPPQQARLKNGNAQRLARDDAVVDREVACVG
jgi:hypothetical protein